MSAIGRVSDSGSPCGLLTAADRISHLRVVEQRWSVELEQLATRHFDRAFHLAAAVDDLRGLIARLEAGQD